MTNHPSFHAVPLELLLHEIEATPQEHWATLLETLRQFRQQVERSPVDKVNLEQAQKNQAAIALLKSWRDEADATEQQQAWNYVKSALVGKQG